MSEWTGEKHLSTDEMKKRFENYVRTFPPFSRIFKDAKIKDVIIKIGPTTDVHNTLVEDNYIAVGDAGGAGTPFIGLGFYTGLEMADYARKTILQAFENNDYSKSTLKMYEKMFNKQFGRWYKWSRLLRQVFMKYSTNREFDNMCKRMECFSDDEYYNILMSYITPKMLFKFFIGKGIGLGVIKNAFTYHVLQILKIKNSSRRPLKTPDLPEATIDWSVVE